MSDQDGEHYPPSPRASASGRIPQWILDEAAGHSPVGGTGPGWVTEARPVPPRKRRTGRLLLAVLTLAAVVVGGVLVQQSPTPVAPTVPPLAAPELPAVVTGPSDFPTPGYQMAPEPLGTPPAAPPEGGEFAFVEEQEDGVTPVAYDPCRPVDVVVNATGAPAGADAMVRDALARMTETTGLRFRYEGSTDELPVEGREVFQPERYGDRWAPVLIGWLTPEQQPALGGQVAGLGGSAWAAVGTDDTRAYVSGSITLDGPEFADLVGTDRGTAIARSILLHELGHVVGLQHVWDTDQLMYATTDGHVLDFAPGDRAGLVQLGAGACVPQL